LAFLVEPGRYNIVDSTARESCGGDGSVTLQGATTRLEVISDRSEISIRLQPRSSTDNDWFWIGVVRRVLNGERPGSDHFDEGAVEFLRTRLPEVEAAFGDSTSRAALVARLQAAREERARELFG
jgi:hypothetical protein